MLYRDENAQKQIVIHTDSVADYEVYDNRWRMAYHKDSDNESDDADNEKKLVHNSTQRKICFFLYMKRHRQKRHLKISLI